MSTRPVRLDTKSKRQFVINRFFFRLVIGTGDCDGAVNGANGQPVKVPCSCPPPQDTYIAALTTNVQAGKAVNKCATLIFDRLLP